MFRGFRWQFVTLLFATIILALAIVMRGVQQTQIRPRETAIPTKAEIKHTETPLPPASATPDATSAAPIASANANRFSVYREALVGSVQRLNPMFAHLNPIDRDISSLIFEGLFATNDYGAAIPRLAEEIAVSADNIEYVVKLREDVKWQDGVPFGADDILYTMSLLSDPDYSAFSPAGRFWQTVEVQKLSDLLVRFRLAQPLGSFTSLLTVGIVPEHALRGATVNDLVHHPFNLSPIGTGPYQLGALHTDATGNIGAVLLHKAPTFDDRRDNGGETGFGELRLGIYASAEHAIEAYRANQADVLANTSQREQLLSLPGSRVYTGVESSLTILIYNWEMPIFQDRRVRRALALGLNHHLLMEKYLADNATFADSPFIPGSAVYQPNAFWYSYDQALAASFLEAVSGASSETDDSGDAADNGDEGDDDFTFTLLVQDRSPFRELASDIVEQWHALGFNVTVETNSAEQLLESLDAGYFEAAIVTQQIGIDPDVYRFWHPAGELNYGSVAQNDISELLDTARRTTNGIARHMMYQQFQEKFAEQAIAIPFYYPLYTLVARDSVGGVRLGLLGSGADRYRSFSEWHATPLPG